MAIIDGKRVAEKVYQLIIEKLAKSKNKPGLGIIMVGEDTASEVYVNMKLKKCKNLGISVRLAKLKQDVDTAEVINNIKAMNNDTAVHGVLVQLPLPAHLDKQRILDSVLANKDVDGLNSENLGKLFDGCGFIPCTPKGIIRLLDEYGVELERKRVVVVNHSTLIGKPLCLLLLKRNATVSVCHDKTNKLKEFTSRADILITAAGVPNLIRPAMVKGGAVVIDSGFCQVDGKATGDVDFEGVQGKASLITPVPGGVGPMTVAMLIENLMIAFENQEKEMM